MPIQRSVSESMPARVSRLTHDEAVAVLAALTRPAPDDREETSPPPALVAAMEMVGIDAGLIHAYRQTGVLISEGNDDLWSPEERRRWEAAVESYWISIHG